MKKVFLGVVILLVALLGVSQMHVGGQLVQALLENLSSDPTGYEGRIYYNTTDKQAKIYDGTTWTSIGSGGGGGGGGFNIVSEGGFESPADIDIFKEYEASAVPPAYADVTEVASANVNITHTTFQPPLGEGALSVTFTASASADGIYYAFDPQIINATAKFSMYTQGPINQITIFVLDPSGTVLFDSSLDSPLDYQMTGSTPGVRISGTFPVANVSGDYKLAFQVGSFTGADRSWTIDDFKIEFFADSLTERINSGNYFTNPGVEETAKGFYAFDHGSTSAPTAITDTGPATTYTIEAIADDDFLSTLEPLEGGFSLRVSNDSSNVSGDGVASNFMISKEDTGKLLGLSFIYEVYDHDEMSDGDIDIYIQNVCSGSANEGEVVTFHTAPDRDNPEHLLIRDGINQYKASWTSHADCQKYRFVLLWISTDSGGDQAIFADKFSVGPGPITSAGFDGIWKTYSSSDVGSITLSSGTPSLQNAWFKPFKDTNGDWYLEFSIYLTITSPANDFDISIPGVTFDGLQPLAMGVHGNSATDGTQFSYTKNASDDIRVKFMDSSTENDIIVGGTVLLTSKPTWADFDPIATVYPTSDDLAVTPWQTYVPTTQGLGTISSRLQWRYNHDTVEIRGDFTAGTTTSSEGQIGLPNSETVHLLSSTSTVIVGKGNRDQANRLMFDVLATDGDTFLNFGRHNYAANEDKTSPINGSQITGSSGRFTFYASVPVDRNLEVLPPIGISMAKDGAPGLLIYEQGTWTPTDAGSSANVTGTPSYNTATYTRIGNTVWARIESITGYSVTASNTFTVVRIDTAGLPGLENDTEWFGSARLFHNSSKPVAMVARDSSASNTDVVFEAMSQSVTSPGTATISNLYFHYEVSE